MNRYWLVYVYLAALIFLPACAPAESDPQQPEEKGGLYTFQEPHMGTLFTIRVWLPEKGVADPESVQGTLDHCTLYTRKAFDRVAALNRIFSDYLIDSELSLLSRAPANEPVPVSDELFAILERAQSLSQASGGAFDVTVGPMIRLWRRSRKSRQLPTPSQVKAARARTGYRKLVLDPDQQTVTKLVDDMVLDLGGIAKGYAADEALGILREGGYSRALVAASGDIALGEPPGHAPAWSVALETLEMAEPGEVGLQLKNAAVSTSGDTQRFLVIDGQRYSHIVDKRTGLGLTERIAVSVIASDATTSDSFATAISLLGVEAGMELADQFAAVECRIVRIDANGEPEFFYSKGFPQ